MARTTLILVGLVLASCQSGPHQARLPENTLPAARESPNIFRAYSRDEDATLAGGWSSTFDMSGVSFDSRKTATLVTPRHVVMANHFKRKPGEKVVFHNRKGKRVERLLVDVRKVFTDVAVGLLDRPVPADLKVYPLPAPGTNGKELIGRLAAVTDQNRRIFFHRIGSVSGGLSFRYEDPPRVGWSKKLVGGDSGNPSFLPVGSELILIETHTGGGPGAGPYYGFPMLQEKLQNTINTLSPGYQLRFHRF